MENEIWKEIDGMNGRYLISSLGNVYSVRSKVIMKVFDTNGYNRVKIFKKGYRVHRLVGTHFVPNPENKPYINHINANKKDNRMENLEWCTTEENNKHSADLGLGTPSKKIVRICLDSGEVAIFESINSAGKELPAINAKEKIRKVLQKKWSQYKGNSYIFYEEYIGTV